MPKQLPLWYIKLTNFEYWPYYVLYFPVFWYGIYLICRSRKACYFTSVNPGFKYSGMVNQPKSEILKTISTQYLPKTYSIQIATLQEDIAQYVQKLDLTFPCIAKPETSERGIGVERMHNMSELLAYCTKANLNFVIQEFISFPLEFGVLYYKFPSGKSGITSITQKEFLQITGDGKSSVQALMHQNTRARFRLDYLETKFQSQLQVILPKGESMLLEPIGNHNRGTKFIDAGHLINSKVISVFDTIASTIPGFYYGRFDIKVASETSLMTGEGIRVLEVNGVESEPAHMYDPKHSVWYAWKTILQHIRLVYDIASENRKLGHKPSTLVDLLQAIRSHFKSRAELQKA